MKYASIPWTRTAHTTMPSRKIRRPGFFAWILESLHYSRRLQAERYLRTNRHLIDGAGGAGSKPEKREDDDVAR